MKRVSSSKTANQVKPVLRIFAILAILVQTIFTLNACSGDDGSDGKSCDAVSSATVAGGYDIVCGGVTKGTLTAVKDTLILSDTIVIKDTLVLSGGGTNGKDGEDGKDGKDGKDGANCTLKQDAGGRGPATITCGENSVVIPFCNGKIYSTAEEVCDSKGKNLYSIAQIGTQTWMSEDLEGEFDWKQATRADVCPPGWRLPDSSDFKPIVEAIKEWNIDDSYSWWSATEDNNLNAYRLQVSSSDIPSPKITPVAKTSFMAVRCLKD